MKKLYISNQLHRKFKASSAEQGKTLQVLTETVIEDYLKERKMKK